MKKTLLLLGSLTLLTNSFSQSYNFSTSTGTYANLTGATSLNAGMIWDDPEFTVSLGFTLDFFDTTITDLETSFGLGGVLNSAGTYNNGGIGSIISVYGADLIDRGYTTPGTSLSNISYKLEGVGGSQIFKMEWNNAGFFEDDDFNGSCIDYVNFQLWLYEGTNNIEIHFGPKSISQASLDFGGETGAFIGLFPRYDFDNNENTEDGIVLIGNPSSPTVLATDSIGDHFINGIIPNGTIYKFTRTVPAGILETEELSDISMYPNPASDRVVIKNLKDNKATINILSANGQLVKTTTVKADNSVNISDLEQGVYIFEIQTQKGAKAVKRLVKQ